MGYRKGDWKAICDRCGREFMASQLRKTYDGLMVCGPDWEPQHPQELIRTRTREGQPPPWTRPEAPDHETLACTPASRSPYPDYAIPGCMIPGTTPALIEVLPVDEVY